MIGGGKVIGVGDQRSERVNGRAVETNTLYVGFNTHSSTHQYKPVNFSSNLTSGGSL